MKGVDLRSCDVHRISRTVVLLDPTSTPLHASSIRSGGYAFLQRTGFGHHSLSKHL